MPVLSGGNYLFSGNHERKKNSIDMQSEPEEPEGKRWKGF